MKLFNVEMKPKYLQWALVLLALSSALWMWYHPKVEYKTNEVVVLKPVAGKTVYKLKDCVVPNNTDATVTIATGIIPNAPQGGSVTTDFTPATGDITTSFYPKKAKLFAFENEKSIKILSNGSGGFIEGSWTFARMGVVRLSVGGLGWNLPGLSSGLYGGVGVEARF